MRPGVLGPLALADFRDRARRPAFVLLLASAAGLGYLAAPPASAGYTMVKVGAFRGVYDSGYLGVVVAMAGGLWLSLCGFYAVKGSIGRDAATGVGEVLAATPLTRPAYLLGKFLSNLLVLAAAAGVLALTAPGMLWLRGEADGLDPVALWLPFPLLCLPFLAVAAAAAVVTDAVGPLRGGAGNVVWFFAFLLVFLAGLGGTGLAAIGAGLQADLLAQHPDVPTEISVGLTSEDGGLGLFRWSGLDLTAALVAQQAGLLVACALTALLPSCWLTRFDPGGGTRRATAPAAPAAAMLGARAFAGTARPRTPVVRGPAALGLVVGELRVLLAGTSRWWWLGLLGITVAAGAAPEAGAEPVRLLTWIWPVLLWSRLGAHAHEHGVDRLTGAAAAPVRRLLAQWAAGVAVAVLAGVGPLLRMLVGLDLPGIAAWLAVVAAVPALALLLGSLSRGSRLFQLVHLALWYAAVNGVPVPGPLVLLPAAAGLLGLALAVEGVRHARR